MVRKAKKEKSNFLFPVINFTTFSFNSQISPILKIFILIELVLAFISVLGVFLLSVLKVTNLVH